MGTISKALDLNYASGPAVLFRKVVRLVRKGLGWMLRIVGLLVLSALLLVVVLDLIVHLPFLPVVLLWDKLMGRRKSRKKVTPPTHVNNQGPVARRYVLPKRSVASRDRRIVGVA